MTDPRRPDDDLVSAVLDGEATTEEQARVAGDPVLAGRLAEFRAVAHRLAEPVAPVDDAIRDQAIARALAGGRGGTEDPGPKVVSLEQARNGRRFKLSGRVLAAAAAVVGVLAIAGGLLTSGDGDDAADQAAGTANDSSLGAAAGDIPTPPLDLGTVDDPETLRSRLDEAMGLGGANGSDGGAFVEGDDAETPERASEPEQAAPTTSASPQDLAEGTVATRTLEDCTIELVEDRPELSGQLAEGIVTYQGADAYVFAYIDTTIGGAVGIVSAVADCTVLAEVPL